MVTGSPQGCLLRRCRECCLLISVVVKSPVYPPPAERGDSRRRGSQEGACALAPAAEGPSGLPSASACSRASHAPGAGASPSSVRGGAGKRRGEKEAGFGGGARVSGTREAWRPG